MLIISFICGANIAEKPWTNKRKSKSLLVENSRPNLFTRSKKSNKKLAFISASAVGIYGAVNGKKFVLKLRSRDDFV
jgi:NAD dependent epimerase/dehydratase family enzyme